VAIDRAVHAQAPAAWPSSIHRSASRGQCDVLHRNDRFASGRQLPRDFSALFDRAKLFFIGGVEEARWQIINHALVMAAREKAGREPSPTAGVIDSQRSRRRKAADREASMLAR